jgi:hypothetical protein
VTIFDLLFLVAALVSVLTLIWLGFLSLRRKRDAAFKILRVYGLCAVGYLLVAVTVDFLKPQRIIPIGNSYCLDDWCLTAKKVNSTRIGSDMFYRLELQVSSKAGRITQRANRAWIYLIDERGHLYSPEANFQGVPLDVALGPHETLSTERVFVVPATIQHLGLVTGHGGPYCGPMDILIIGAGGCLFRKPTVIEIQ